jgi:hypothetical protein
MAYTVHNRRPTRPSFTSHRPGIRYGSLRFTLTKNLRFVEFLSCAQVAKRLIAGNRAMDPEPGRHVLRFWNSKIFHLTRLPSSVAPGVNQRHVGGLEPSWRKRQIAASVADLLRDSAYLANAG